MARGSGLTIAVASFACQPQIRVKPRVSRSGGDRVLAARRLIALKGTIGLP